MKYYHLQWDLLASYWQCEILKSHLNCIEALLHCQQSRRGLRACVNAFHNFPHVFQPNILEHLFKSLCLFQLNWKQFCTLNKPHSHYWAFSWFVKTREEKVQRVLIAVFSYLMSDYTEDKVFLEEHRKTQNWTRLPRQAMQSPSLALFLTWLNEDWSNFVGPDLSTRLHWMISPYNTKILTLNTDLTEMEKCSI